MAAAGGWGGEARRGRGGRVGREGLKGRSGEREVADQRVRTTGSTEREGGSGLNGGEGWRSDPRLPRTGAQGDRAATASEPTSAIIQGPGYSLPRVWVV